MATTVSNMAHISNKALTAGALFLNIYRGTKGLDVEKCGSVYL
jgi:hypothetical protein